MLKQAVRRTGLTRRRVSSVRVCCERKLMARLFPAEPARSRILCYHSVGTESWGHNDVSPGRFARHIDLALEAGYRFVPADLIASDVDSDNHRLAITFDDGLRSVALNAAPVLASYGIPWTIFVVSNWADGDHNFGDGVMLSWDEIESLASQGATIGSHSVSHPNFGRLRGSLAEQELDESRLTIAARTGIVPNSFAIPFGQSKDWTPEARAAAIRAGYQFVYAQAEETRADGTIPRTFVTRYDSDRVFRAALGGVFDRWEEWT